MLGAVEAVAVVVHAAVVAVLACASVAAAVVGAVEGRGDWRMLLAAAVVFSSWIATLIAMVFMVAVRRYNWSRMAMPWYEFVRFPFAFRAVVLLLSFATQAAVLPAFLSCGPVIVVELFYLLGVSITVVAIFFSPLPQRNARARQVNRFRSLNEDNENVVTSTGDLPNTRAANAISNAVLSSSSATATARRKGSSASLSVASPRKLGKCAMCHVAFFSIATVLFVSGTIAMWSAGYSQLGGQSIPLSNYDDDVAYWLPWQRGVTAMVVQANGGVVSHNNVAEKFATDFWLTCGVTVNAARAGVVVEVEDTRVGRFNGNNYIVVAHNDGGFINRTSAHYLHILPHSAAVQVGDHVDVGDVLALVGDVGNALTGHLHFHVTRMVYGNTTYQEGVGARFVDVTDNGDRHVPLLFHHYTPARP